MAHSTGWLQALADQKLTVHSARDAAQVVGWLDTGNYALNWAISGRFLRGYPLGHSVEFFGDPSTGKSFLIDRAIAMVQAAGGVALLDDTEGAHNLEWMEKALGVDVDALAYSRSHTVKQHLDLAVGFLKAVATLQRPRTLRIGVLACDSVAQLSTVHELETQLEKRDMSKAAELKAMFRIIGGQLSALPVAYLVTNHTIANVGNMFNKRTTPGGGGLKFHATIRIDLRSPSKIKGKNSGEYLGVMCRAVVDKNRLTAPWREVRLVIPFNQPISRASGLIPVLVSQGILTVRGQFLMHGRERVGRAYKPDDKNHVLQQDEQAEALLDRVPELLEEADAFLEAHPAILPTTVDTDESASDTGDGEETDGGDAD